MINFARRIALGVTALTVMLLASLYVTNAAVATPTSVLSGSLQTSTGAEPYEDILDWDYCLSDSGKYMYLETKTSLCGSGGSAGTWSFSYASKPSAAGVSNLEVCHSADHSATTTMHYLDNSGYHTLSDSAGGGCALAQSTGLDHFYVTWALATSPSI